MVLNPIFFLAAGLPATIIAVYTYMINSATPTDLSDILEMTAITSFYPAIPSVKIQPATIYSFAGYPTCSTFSDNSVVGATSIIGLPATRTYASDSSRPSKISRIEVAQPLFIWFLPLAIVVFVVPSLTGLTNPAFRSSSFRTCSRMLLNLMWVL